MSALRLIRIAGLVAMALAAMIGAGGKAFAASPTVTSISTNPFNPSGGQTVTINGSGFTGATSVTIGSNAVTSFTVNSDTQITATTPPDSPVPPSPTVLSISNGNTVGSTNVGPTGGGTPVTITGTNFSYTHTVDVVVTTSAASSTGGTGLFNYTNVVTAVFIGGTAASSFNIANSTHITLSTPPGVAGVADVVVTTTDGANSGTSGQGLWVYTPGGPSLSTIGPTFGLTSGGNQVTITGSNFVPGTFPNGTPATTVTIGGNAATNVAVTNTTTITATAPAGTAGVADVKVTTQAGSTDAYLYQYIAPATPVVASVSINMGNSGNGCTTTVTCETTAGGTNVTISGSNFTGATSVMIGGTSAQFTVNGPGSISATTPMHAAGTVDVTVTVAVPGGGTFSGTGAGLWTYVAPPPSVTSITPNVGTTAGGTPVTIVGSYFTSASSVTLGGTPVTSFTVNSDNQITATTAAHTPAGQVNVVVTTSSGPSTNGTNLYTYGTPPPTVSSVSPAGGSIAGGTIVTITGAGFTGATAVTIGNAVTSYTVNSDTQITATTAAHAAGAVNVSVTTAAGTGTGSTYTYGASPPTVSSISPTSGSVQGGTLITITGTGFSGTPQVTVGGVPAGQPTLVSSTQVTAVTPAGTGTKDVVVTTSFGASATNPGDLFTYTTTPPPAPPAPIVTSISPPSGTTAGGTSVTITGTYLAGATLVMIGGNPATAVSVSANGSTITAVTPPGAVGLASVAVTTPGGVSVGGPSYTYVQVAPTVTSINPNTGTTAGGTLVTISGTNFTTGATVKIGSTAATGVTVVNATTITATTPANATAGAVNVAVTTTAGTGTGTNLFTYVAQAVPTVTAISPAVGPTAGGTSVTITGTNFTGATAVTIGGNAATLVQVVSATSITATTPPGSAGAANVVVTTPAGSGTGTGLFTYDAAPTVTGVSPAIGAPAGGTSVTISGTNFVVGATTVKFGNTTVASVTVNSSTLISVTAPAGTGTVDVTVTTPGGTSVISRADQFTYAAVPAVTAISPNAGVPGGGTVVTITGTGFTGATAVMFGGTGATSISVNGTGTSITVTSPPGTGTVDVTVTTPGGTSAASPADRFSYGKASTALTLTSSPNPSALGQLVTFTATVTGNSPTGTVIFSQGGQQIGTGTLSHVTATSSVASFATSSLPLGADVVTASYGGDANNAADPQTITQYVNGPSDSAKLREMQISVMPIVANISGEAITSAIDNAIGVGFGSTTPAPTPNGSGFTYYFDPDAPEQKSPTTASGKIDGDFAALAYAPNTLNTVRPAASSYAPPRAWLAWIDLRGTDFDRNSYGSDLKGVQANAIAGLTYRFSSNFIVGVLGGYEHFDFTSQAYNGVLTGQGLTAGAYLGWRLTPGLRFTAGGAWSDLLAAETAGTAAGNFTGQRGLAFGGLTGDFGWRGLMFEPSARAYALWERENAYTDTLGTQQAAHDFGTGRASAGLKVAYPFTAGAGSVAPYVGLYGEYYFTMDNATTIGLTTVPILQGFGARATGGLTATLPSGAQLSAGGELSGIGNDTHIWTVTVRGSVPF